MNEFPFSDEAVHAAAKELYLISTGTPLLDTSIYRERWIEAARGVLIEAWAVDHGNPVG